MMMELIYYMDKPEDVLKKVIELIENGGIGEGRIKARKFSWDNITSEFEGDFEGGCSGWMNIQHTCQKLLI